MKALSQEKGDIYIVWRERILQVESTGLECTCSVRVSKVFFCCTDIQVNSTNISFITVTPASFKTIYREK